MIDTSKLLSKRTSRKALLSREGVTNLIIIKKNVVKIDGLLKERLVLSKVREGLLKQQRENERRRERERQLEAEREDDDTDVDPKSKKKSKSMLGGILKVILGGFLKFIGRLTFGILPKLPLLLKSIKLFTKIFISIMRGGFNFVRVFIRMGAPLAKSLLKVGASIFNQIYSIIVKSIVPAAGGFLGRIAAVLGAPLSGALARRRLTGATTDNLSKLSKDESLLKVRPVDPVESKIIKKERLVDNLTEAELKEEIKLRKKIRKKGFLFSEEDIVKEVRDKRKEVAEIARGREIQKKLAKGSRARIARVKAKEISESLGASARDKDFFKRLGLDPALGKRGADPKEIARQKKLLRKRMSPSFDKKLTERVLREAEIDGSLRTRVQLENAMDPLRTRKPGEDILGDLFKRVDDPKQIMLDQPLMKAPIIKAQKITGKKGLAKFLGNIGGAQFLKPIRKFLNNTVKQIPFLGDLIGLLLDIFVFGEPVGRAAFMAIGGILGGFLGGAVGSLVPGPGTIIGGIIGGIGGDIIGGLIYDLIFGRKPAVNEAGTVTKGVVKGVSKGVQKFEEGGLVREYEPLPQIPFDKSTNLRSLAFYEKTQVGREVMVPIPIPIPSSRSQSQGSSIVVNQTSEKRTAFSQHYRRG